MDIYKPVLTILVKPEPIVAAYIVLICSFSIGIISIAVLQDLLWLCMLPVVLFLFRSSWIKHYSLGHKRSLIRITLAGDQLVGFAFDGREIPLSARSYWSTNRYLLLCLEPTDAKPKLIARPQRWDWFNKVVRQHLTIKYQYRVVVSQDTTGPTVFCELLRWLNGYR